MGFKDTDISGYADAIAPNGDYSYNNKKNNTVGKYQFNWAAHAPDIQKVTGIKNKEDFISNPDAQDKYFQWHVENNLKPAVAKLSSINKAGLDDTALAKLVNERGANGAKRWLQQNTKPVDQQKTDIPNRLKGVEQDMSPVTDDERTKWEKMQGEAYKRGFKGDDFNTAPGIAFMKEMGVDPARLSAFQQDFQQKSQETPMAGVPTVRSGPEGLSKVDNFYGDKTAQQRYTTYALKVPGQPEQDFGTNRDAMVAANNKYVTPNPDEFKGFDDPTQNVNYVAPGQTEGGPYGFSGSGHASATPVQAAVPNPAFPTRDPVTGIVTPASQPKIAVTPATTPPVAVPAIQPTSQAQPDTPPVSAQPSTNYNFDDFQKLPKSTQIEIMDKFHGLDADTGD